MNFTNYSLAKKLYKIDKKETIKIHDYPNLEKIYESISNKIKNSIEEIIEDINKPLKLIPSIQDDIYRSSYSFNINDNTKFVLDKTAPEKVRIITLKKNIHINDIENIQSGDFNLLIRVDLDQKRIEKINVKRLNNDSPFDFKPISVEGYKNNGELYRFESLLKILYENIASQINRELKYLHTEEFKEKINFLHIFIMSNEIYGSLKKEKEKFNQLAEEGFVFDFNNLNESFEVLSLSHDFTIPNNDKRLGNKPKC